MSIRRALPLAVASAFAPFAAQAAASFKDVWYPDGQIRYYVESGVANLRGTLEDTMTYMAEHTPLVIEKETSADAANLRFSTYSGVFNDLDDGGTAKSYWDENRADSNKKLRFDPSVPPEIANVTHLLGHALGRPHEFQRDDRDSHVSVCFNVDPTDFSPLGGIYWPDPYYNLSPYDEASVMNDGYDSCVTPLPGEGHADRKYDLANNPLSVHDINGIYRMYGTAMGTNDPGDRFGAAVASGDYDNDGFKDVAVANVQGGGIWLSFYRGVMTDASEGVTGLEWMPWFKVEYDDDVHVDARVTLATGDYNGDGIDDLALGEPDYDGYRGRVSVLFVNTAPSDPAKSAFEQQFAPWGRKGIQYRIDLDPADVGLATGSPQFGAALATARVTDFFGFDYDDLVVGAPFAEASHVAKGAAVVLQGRFYPYPSDFTFVTSGLLWNPKATAGEFGAAVAAVPGACTVSGKSSKDYIDDIAVGAPGNNGNKGAVHVYGCTTMPPSLLHSSYSTGNAGRYGQALAGFRIYDGASRKSYLAIGQPEYVANDGKVVGRVALHQISSSGVFTFVEGYVPGVHDGQDEFGTVLAVQQRPYSDTVTDEGGRETFIGIGMPGAKIDGVRAGKVYVWRPFNSDGSLHGTAEAIEAFNPDPASDTRFGDSIAALRPLKDQGGFVAGAPDAITTADDVQAGQASTLQNAAGPYDWDGVRWNLNQETEGDKRPTNR